MIRQELDAYLQKLRDEHTLPDYLPRYFMAHDEWNRLAREEHYRRHGVFREMYPGLANILQHQRVVILGEPGAGKSYIASAVVIHIAEAGPADVAPVHAHLSGYRGSLVDLLNQVVPQQRILTEQMVDERELRRVYVLDGLDEAPKEQVGDAVRDIEQLLEADQQAHLVLTCRQAFFEGNRHYFSVPPAEFHVLDFAYEDIRLFVENKGLDCDAFMQEVRRADLETEVSNPFILDAAVDYFSAEGRLGERRSDIVSYVIEKLIASRPRFAAHKQRRALRMLAIAMETYCRNVLTIEEGRQVLLQSMRTDEAEANDLLDDLGHSILVRTPSGISFQMRSHGEYLAAEELEGASLEKVLGLVCVDDTRIPNESWLSTVSYLVEMNEEARRYFLHHHPRWVLRASPSTFNEQERTELVQRLLEVLGGEREYLVHHPLVNHRELARHVTEGDLPQLLQDTTSEDSVRAANALVLLAHRENRDCLETALTLALDRSSPPYLRRSAIFAVANLGSSELIPRLVDTLDTSDPMNLSIVDCIGALMDESSISIVLPLFLQTSALISSALTAFGNSAREKLSRQSSIS